MGGWLGFSIAGRGPHGGMNPRDAGNTFRSPDPEELSPFR
jgi:hypothetical protein